MTAATGDNQGERQPADIVQYQSGVSTIFYKDCAVMSDGAGAIKPVVVGAGASMATFLGVVDDRVDQSRSLTGLSCIPLRVWKSGEFTFNAAGTGASAHIGRPVYFHDDQTVGISAAYPRLLAGEVTGMKNTSTYRVRITQAVGQVSKFDDGITNMYVGGTQYTLPTAVGTSGQAMIQGTSNITLTFGNYN